MTQGKVKRRKSKTQTPLFYTTILGVKKKKAATFNTFTHWYGFYFFKKCWQEGTSKLTVAISSRKD